MSTIEPNTESLIVSPELRGRIFEIMEEKGKAFTQQALAIRIGINYETLRKKLRGERELHMFELRRIAEAFHMSLERLLQIDTHDDEKKLSSMFASLVEDESVSKIPPDLDEMLMIAQRLSSIAVGRTERCKTLIDLGRAYFYLHRYEEAHEEWVESLQYAKQVADKNNNLDSYHLVLSNLLLSYSVKPNQLASEKFLDEIEVAFSSNPHRLGIVYYARAKKAEYQGKLTEAKKHAKKSLDYFLLTNNYFSIGTAESTVAHYEFLDGNFVKSKELLESSIRNLEPYKRNWIISIKDYAKTLLKLQEFQNMKNIVEDALLQVDKQSPQFRDTVGKLKILLSMCKNEVSDAESVLFDNSIHVDVRTLAYKYLRRYCIQNGDHNTLMKYVIMEDELETTKNDLLDGEL